MTRRRALLVTAGLLALLALCAGAAVVTDVVHYVTGRHGTITVRACIEDYGARKVRYECTGTFDAADGTDHREAGFIETYARSPGARVPATLNGATVNEVSPAGTATGTIVAVASLAGVAALLLIRRRLPRP
jgi:MYXO-CTERM domain-containing protein